MKKLYGIILFIVVILCIGLLCLNRDLPDKNEFHAQERAEEKIIYPANEKNVTVDGTDFLQSQAPVGKFGGELILSTIGEGPKTFNPCNTRDATSSAMAGLMYDGLLSANPRTGEVVPLLAKSFEIKDNDYIIHLRNGIKWSDGEPVTADDVMYTYQEIVFKGLGNPSSMEAMTVEGKLPEIEKIDDYTVKFTISKPFAPFLRQLSYPIVPKHYFKPYSDKDSTVFDAFLSPDTNPKTIVYSGAFHLKEYVAAQRVVFERNPNYYKINTKGERLPYLDKIVYLIVGDTNNQILKFEAGEIDELPLKGDSVARYKSRETYSDYKVYNLGPDTGTLFIAINMNNRKDKNGKYFVDKKKQEWFGNKDFRTAVDYALDRKNMVQNIAFGVAKPLFTPESLNSIYLNKNIYGHEKNVNKSKELLVKAGFKTEQGILYDSSGNRVEFDLYTNAGNLEREALGVMVKQDLEDLGMKINFKPIEFNSLVNKLTQTYDWDMVIMGLTGSPLEPHDGKHVWISNGSLHMFNMRDRKDKTSADIYPWEKELDEIFEQAALKLTYNERKPYYDRYQEIIYDEKPMIYLYSPVRITAIRKKIKNLFPTPLSGLLYNVDELYVE